MSAGQSPLGKWRDRLKEMVSAHRSLAILLAVTVCWQLLFVTHATPNVFPDTGSYSLLAEAIVKGEWPDPGFAFRTPGYPLFLLLIFSLFGWGNWTAVMWAQFAIGVFIPVLLYFLFLPLARQRWLAATGAATYLLDRYSLALQTVPLTEFLSGFTALVALVSYVYGFRTTKLKWATVAGILATLNVLVRPSFQLLFYAVAAWGILVTVLYPTLRSHWKVAARWTVAYLLAMQLGLWAWSYVVWRHIGVFALSVQLGASMTNHTGSFMEDAPDEYAKIRDIYVAERNARNGDHINLFDNIGWKICEATGLKKWELSLKFHEINKCLLPRHLSQYFRQVRNAWVRMWTEPSRYITDWTDPVGSGTGRFEETPLFQFIVRNPILRLVYWPIEKFLWSNRSLLLVIPYLMMLFAGICCWRNRRKPWAVLVAVLIPATVLYHVLVHIAVQYTEFGRYRLPVQFLWFTFCGFALVSLLDEFRLQLQKNVGDLETVAAVTVSNSDSAATAHEKTGGRRKRLSRRRHGR